VYDKEAEEAASRHAELPWVLRGPPGPQTGGPQVWRGQKWREGSQRFANSGGKNKEKYQLWIYKQKDPFYHPKNKEGSNDFIHICCDSVRVCMFVDKCTLC